MLSHLQTLDPRRVTLAHAAGRATGLAATLSIIAIPHGEDRCLGVEVAILNW
jgi:hypothetical protein